MRRARNLFDEIVGRENLRQAFARAALGKRDRPEVRWYAAQLDMRLGETAEQLRAGTISVGKFHQFVIRDPKERIITAPCFAERVLHHAIMQVCEPIFDRRLIDDTFACRRGRGRIAALARSQTFARRFPAFLKLDVRRYFDSISHERLACALERMFKDQQLLALLREILAAFRGGLGRGLPIGSLVSQHLANFYLGALDRFVKEQLRVRGYVRYMDDMVLWGPTTRQLCRLRDVCHDFLLAELDLMPKEPFINLSGRGMDFLGCRVFPTHLELNRRSKTRLRRKLNALEEAHLGEEIAEPELQQRATSLLAFTTAGGVRSWRLRSKLLEKMSVSGQ